MLAVTELCGKLGLIEALDEAMGPVKQRRRGFSGGQVLTGMAAAQLAGEDFLVGLDRVRADQAGQLVTPVPGLAASTATGIARRFTEKQWPGAEAALEEQRNGEWRYLEFLQFRSSITAEIFLREIPGGTRTRQRSRPVDLPGHRY